jgi:hypothetical protein
MNFTKLSIAAFHFQDGICSTMGFFLLSATLSQWSVVIFSSISACSLIVFGKRLKLGHHDWILLMGTFGFAVVIAGICLGFNALGPSGAWLVNESVFIHAREIIAYCGEIFSCSLRQKYQSIVPVGSSSLSSGIVSQLSQTIRAKLVSCLNEQRSLSNDLTLFVCLRFLARAQFFSASRQAPEDFTHFLQANFQALGNKVPRATKKIRKKLNCHSLKSQIKISCYVRCDLYLMTVSSSLHACRSNNECFCSYKMCTENQDRF